MGHGLFYLIVMNDRQALNLSWPFLPRFILDEPNDEIENDVQELVEKFRRNALTLLELLDLSVPAVAKLSVSF